MIIREAFPIYLRSTFDSKTLLFQEILRPETYNTFRNLVILGVESRRSEISAEVARSINKTRSLLKTMIDQLRELERHGLVHRFVVRLVRERTERQLRTRGIETIGYLIELRNDLTDLLIHFFPISHFHHQCPEHSSIRITCPFCSVCEWTPLNIILHLKTCKSYAQGSRAQELAETAMGLRNLELKCANPECGRELRSLGEWTKHVRNSWCKTFVDSYSIDHPVDWVLQVLGQVGDSHLDEAERPSTDLGDGTKSPDGARTARRRRDVC